MKSKILTSFLVSTESRENQVLPSHLLSDEGYNYLGCEGQSSSICFNKITTKLWSKELGVPVTPFIIISKTQYKSESDRIIKFFNEHGKDVFIKTPSQGSSIGCYNVTKESMLVTRLEESFKFNQVS